MGKLLRWMSVILFTLLSGFLIWFGWLYASVEELLWFHAAAVPEASREAVRSLYFALMNLIGGSSLGLGMLGLFVTLTSIRRGAKDAAAALSLAYMVPFAMAAVTAEALAKTGAPTSWHIMGILIFITAIALLASFASNRARDGKSS
jgi:hypothetical protein